MTGGVRSRSEAKLNAQVTHMRSLFESAAAEMGARADVVVTRSYGAIDVSPAAPLIQELRQALLSCGFDPVLMPTGGGSDANIFNDLGIEAVNLGVGYADMHSTSESIAVRDLVKVAEVLVTVLRA